VLKKDQEIGDAIGFAVFDERALQRQRIGVRNEAEPADFEGTQVYTCSGSKCSICSLIAAMN
jgi:hypothetical protein